jgi:hypothetical protein
MKMTMEQQIDAMAQRIAMLENRVAMLEAKGMTYGPLPTIPPTNPWPPQHPWTPNPYGPPYTVTCKLADGTTREMTFTAPIVAQTNS